MRCKSSSFEDVRDFVKCVRGVLCWRDPASSAASSLVCGATVPGESEGMRKEVLHSCVMEEDTPQYSNMPKVVAASNIVEHAWAPPLRHLASIDESAEEVDRK